MGCQILATQPTKPPSMQHVQSEKQDNQLKET